ncbi:MAG: two-component system, chemotaxis family, CheB/CheR fusion protein [Acidobacteriota bacterium]|nr:two-component system, chemotaxis family, CheB/CheR fusion protein [Acidobacteriota bacterium]
MPFEQPLVLIVDPDASRRERVRSALHGFRVDEAEGWDAIQERHPDLVVADLRQAGLDRLGERDVPVVLLGHAGDPDECVEALEGGADDFLSDSFDPQELCCRVRVRLEQGQEKRRAAERERELLAEAQMAAEALERSRRAEAALRDTEEELRAANEAKDRFLATLSHELRTPLTPILALVSSFQEDDRFPPDLRSQLVVIRRNVELEARLIDDLLDLTRVARGKLVLHRQAADVAEVLAHALRSVRDQMASKGVRLAVDLAEGRLLAWADPARLTQVFWNLLSNALKFTPEGGTITVRSRLEGSSVTVEVCDTGIGIDPEVLPRIFGAFEQADPRITRRFGGLGLGLAVSRALMRLHGGDLTAASEGTGCGAMFTVRLPAGVPERDLDETVVTFPRESEARLDRGLRLLLVEDHADTAKAMAELLGTLGHEVTVAGSVAGAREAAQGRELELDLVISDLGLPDGTGLDLMRELAAHGLRGIALSGYGMDEDIQRSREAGFTDHLTKPVTLQMLQEAILQATRR